MSKTGRAISILAVLVSTAVLAAAPTDGGTTAKKGKPTLADKTVKPTPAAAAADAGTPAPKADAGAPAAAPKPDAGTAAKK